MGTPSTARRAARRAALRRVVAGTAGEEDISKHRGALEAEEAKYLRAAPTTPEHVARYAAIRAALGRPA